MPEVTGVLEAGTVHSQVVPLTKSYHVYPILSQENYGSWTGISVTRRYIGLAVEELSSTNMGEESQLLTGLLTYELGGSFRP